MERFLIFFALTTLIGSIVSYYVSKSKFPTVTGLIIVGIFVSLIPNFKNLISQYSSFANIIIELAPTVLLFESGLEFGYLRIVDRKTIIASFIQSLITYVFVFIISRLVFKLTFLESLITGTILMVTGTDVAITILKFLNIDPTDKVKLGLITIFDDFLAEIFFFIFLPILKFSIYFTNNASQILTESTEEVILSILLGVLFGVLIAYFIKWSKMRYQKIVILFSIILLIFGISIFTKTHTIVVALISGVIISFILKGELVKQILIPLREFDSILYTLFIIYVINSAGITKIEKYFLLGLIALFIRLIGKSIGSFFIFKMKLLQSSRYSDILISLLPQSILSLYFAYEVRNLITTSNFQILPVTIAGVIIFEVIGKPREAISFAFSSIFLTTSSSSFSKLKSILALSG